MKTFKKILLAILVISVSAVLCVYAYKASHLEITRIHDPNEIKLFAVKDTETVLYESLQYNGNLYYAADELNQFPEYAGVFQQEAYTDTIAPYTFHKNVCTDKMYYVFINYPLNVLFAERFYTYNGDDSVIFLENTSFLGPHGWIYVREGYEFPTLQKNKPTEIFLCGSYDEDLYIPEEQHAEILKCITEHGDLTEFPMIRDNKWRTLCVNYENSGLTEMLAMKDYEGNITYIEGGTK